MLNIDKVAGNVQDNYSSKFMVQNFEFDFDTQENNLDFGYHCLRYHLKYLVENYKENEGGTKIGKTFGFHYHIKESNEWYYFTVSFIDDGEIDVEDFMLGKINPRISISSSQKVENENDLKMLESGFNLNS